ncbi:MAG TPA: AIPR family protein [Verrucomicrobiae bacterium]|nr:AIPR family protein [Verrucomicrobiae bacterium]
MTRQGTPARMREWEQQNPPHQKFTKTDLAKFEHSWMALPHLVCKGAEKNFIEFAQKHDEDGEPLVDLNCFKHIVAKAILFRTTEKLVSAQEFGGYRANIVAYTIAWLAEKSGQRIDLETIWNEQKVSPTLCDTITEVCKAANEHLLAQTGNVGEVSKRAECWEEFRKKKLKLSKAWEDELSATAFVAPTCEEDALAPEWDKIRKKFTNDARTIEGLEAYTGKVWVPSKRRDLVASYAVLTWDQLRMRPGLGLKKLRSLVEMFAAALD